MSRRDAFSKYWVKLTGQANHILSGASDAEIRVQVFDVLEEFFDLSNTWHEQINFTVIPNTLDYPLTPASGRILRLNEVWDQNSAPQQAVMPEIGTVHFLYPYTTVQQMTADVVKTVSDPLTIHPPYIPDWILPAHSRVLLSGILGYMMSQPGQSYTNPQLANFHLMKFKDGCAKARSAAMRANKIGAQAWTYPRQFRTFSQKGGMSTFNPPGRV